ncbi:Hypothetical protein R9X50_00197100 [Acrodontium crateriforme]|uniref:uracil phosphoribosyltransferase n=1 Tax=Acrodontium crateriforme TaxID=150365 RepID=A0AAQ3R885_9PEZI|nr:Hypothetical protein R9X50_00197100 [Acrodontium crateriforme]
MATSLPANVHVSTHPCLAGKLSQLRSSSTNARDFRTLVHDIATILGCEALAQNLTVVEKGTDTSPLGYTYATKTTSPAQIALVPILRSGLSMQTAIEALLPTQPTVHHLGMYREKTTLQPVEYYNNLPYHSASATTAGGTAKPVPDLAIVIDPIIATGSTVCAAIDTLRDWGVPRILTLSVLGSVEGVARAAATWPEGVEMWVGGVDAETDERGMIVPGLGDCGDRLYLTVGK